jgi:hypothetical protein
LPDRFGEVRRDTESPTTGCVAPLTGGGEHHDGDAGEARLFLDSLDQGEPVHVRHVDVGKQEGKRLSGLAGLAQLPQRVHGPRRNLRPHAPTGHHLLEDEPIRRIVIDDQHPQAA